MRTFFCALLLGLMAIAAGCGGSPEEADTTHLDSPEAEAAAAAARGKYENMGRFGPEGPPGKKK